MSEPLLAVEDLTIQYETRNGKLTAASNVSFDIEEGEYFGLAGESGCGKTTVAKAILGGLDENGEIASGTIRYKGEPIQDFSESEFSEKVRWTEISWIPQGSMSSLNPLLRISEQAAEIAAVHTTMNEEAAVEKVKELFAIVGLSPERVTDYPHQFSGGMQQRALIALSLFLEPSLLIADEPTTALDVIMQDQVFRHLDEIQAELDISMLLITHDISVVLESCERMGVMHSGQISEVGSVHAVYNDSHHPYTILLKRAFPDIRYPDRTLGVIEGDPPQNIGEVDYCSFAQRCPWAIDECELQAPELRSPSTGDEGHEVACVRRDEMRELVEQDGGNP